MPSTNGTIRTRMQFELDLRNRPLIERKERLACIVRPPALFVQYLDRHGVDLFREVCARDMEGIGPQWGQMC